MHRVNTMVNEERDKVEEKSNEKQALTMNGFPPSLECTTSVSCDDTSVEVRESEIGAINKKPTRKKSPVVLPYI